VPAAAGRLTEDVWTPNSLFGLNQRDEGLRPAEGAWWAALALWPWKGGSDPLTASQEAWRCTDARGPLRIADVSRAGKLPARAARGHQHPPASAAYWNVTGIVSELFAVFVSQCTPTTVATTW
jgi:hypothetical protein